jgi:hypothetical protein
MHLAEEHQQRAYKESEERLASYFLFFSHINYSSHPRKAQVVTSLETLTSTLHNTTLVRCYFVRFQFFASHSLTLASYDTPNTMHFYNKCGFFLIAVVGIIKAAPLNLPDSQGRLVDGLAVQDLLSAPSDQMPPIAGASVEAITEETTFQGKCRPSSSVLLLINVDIEALSIVADDGKPRTTLMVHVPSDWKKTQEDWEGRMFKRSPKGDKQGGAKQGGAKPGGAKPGGAKQEGVKEGGVKQAPAREDHSGSMPITVPITLPDIGPLLQPAPP